MSLPRPYRKDGRPRGLVSTTARQREAYEMWCKGATRVELREHFGVSMYAINSWIERLQDAETDAAHMRRAK